MRIEVKMDKQKLKLISIYSLIFGAVWGLIAVIPVALIQFLCWVMMAVFSSVCVILYMKKKNEIGDLTIKGGTIIGILIGFISLLGFLLVFLPLNALLGIILNKVTDLFSLSRFLLGIWWLLIIMVGLISALFNSFSLIAYVYIRDTFFMIEGKKEIKGVFKPKDRNNGF